MLLESHLSWLPSSSLGDSWLPSFPPPSPTGLVNSGSRRSQAELSRQLRRWRAAETLACSALKSWAKQSFLQSSRVLMQLCCLLETVHSPGFPLPPGERQSPLRTQRPPRGLQPCSQSTPPSLGFVSPLPLCHMRWTLGEGPAGADRMCLNNWTAPRPWAGAWDRCSGQGWCCPRQDPGSNAQVRQGSVQTLPELP